ncbi:hypothetical protein [Salinibacterium sp. TMP30]|uniref:hypothetical protein n=1 Tax=Salinibacterium sp. TMP30 TaxID=3138237 RepID=UPI0031389D56
MFMKKLLATVASIALTGGALLGVSAPAFADEASAPPSAPNVSAPGVSALDAESVAPTPEPAQQSTSSVAVANAPAPVAKKSAPVVDAPATEVEAPASPSRSTTNTEKKVWVCKFVSSDNSPSGYRLKDGEQPIHVSINALGDDVNDSGDFNDSQPSFVVPDDDASLCSSTEVTVDEEVECPTYQYGGRVYMTTATKWFYGATQVDFTITQGTRALSVGERVACDPPEEVFVCQFVASEDHPSGWVLTPGDQPVLTLRSELGDDVNDTGDYDINQTSFIVASDDSDLCTSNLVERSTEVICATVSADGRAIVTTVSSVFYGTVKVTETRAEEVRGLTERELRDCSPVELAKATAEVSLIDASCNAPQQLILGAISNATWGAVTDPVGPQDYRVTATANPGAEFTSGGPALIVAAGTTTLTFAGTLNPQLDPADPACDLETLGLVMPAVTFSQTSCNVAGSYRLGVAPGYDPALVTFTVNGVAGIVAGTYTVAGPGSVEVTVQVVDPNGLEFDWVDPPAFAFVVPEGTACDPDLPTLALGLPTLALGLPTLAFTGSGGAGPLWWLVPSGMILLGAAAVYVRRRLDAVS